MTDFANLGLRFVPVDDAAANKALTDVAANSAKAESATKKLTATQAAAANAQKAVAQAAQAQAAAVGQMGEAMQIAAAQQAASIKAMESAAALHGKVAGATKITAAQTLNLSRQFADVAVTGAMGMSPLMILIQQGPQIGETIGEIARDAGGLSGALRLMATSAWAALAPFAPFIAAGAALAAVLGGSLLMATHELNKGNDDLQKRLGLTDEQMKKVGNTSITVADVIQGTFKYAAKAIGEQFAPQITWLQKAFAAAYEFIKNATVSAVKVFAGLWGAQIAVVQALWHNVKAFMKGEPLIDVKDAALKGYADAVAGVDRTMSGLAKTIREVRDARVIEAAGTAKATKELKDHTKATKDYLTVAEMVADTSKTVDILASVKAIKVDSVPDLKNVAGEAAKAWEEYQAEGQRVIEGLGADIEREFVRSGKLSWNSIGNYAEQTLRQAVYDALLKKPIQIIIDGVFGNLEKLKAILGNALGGSLGKVLGAAGVGASIGQSMGLGTGNTLADLGLAAGGGALGTMAGSALGTWAAAAAGQAALTGASTMLATTLGWLAPALGPIGAIVGLAAGTLFKKKPSNNGALATLDGNTFSLSGNKRTDETSQMATNAANAILQGQSILEAAGIKLAATVKTIDIGTRDATDIVLSDGRALTSAVGDAAAAAETALKAVLQGATYASDAQKKLVENMLAAGKGFDDIAKSLQAYQAAQGFVDGVNAQIKALTDPGGAELDQLLASQKAQRDSLKAMADAGYLTAEQVAEASKQLGVLEALQLDKLFKSMAGAGGALATKVDEARTALSDAYNTQSQALGDLISRFSALADSLRKFRSSLDASSLGGLSPEDRYATTKAAFDDVSRRAKLGDETALNDLQSVSQAYLEASKDYYATTEPYFRDLKAVKEALQGAQDTADRTVANAQAQLSELQKMVAGLIDVKAATLSVADAVKALNGALAAQTAAIQAAQGKVGTSAASGGAGFDGSSYLQANPDVAAAYQDYLSGTGPYSWAYASGLSAADFAKAHYDMQGKSEGRTGYATGAVLTRPISLGESGVAGEAGPEGILPLANVNGRLGVRAVVGGGSDQETKDLLRQILAEMRAANTLGSASAQQTLQRLDKLASNGEAQIRKLARQ